MSTPSGRRSDDPASRHVLLDTLPRVKVFKRLLVVLGLMGLVGMLARLRGKGGVPPTSGGWRELEGPEFR
jgi:hypothetical protein